MFNPDRVAGPEVTRMDEESLFMASEFADMPEPVLLSEFEKTIYITSSEQRRFFDNISKVEDKRRWLFLFWRSKDTNKATPFNEYRAQYMERVNYANENYATFTKEGWRSDRGRVLLMYGEPDFIERYPNTPDRKPGEIWSYNQIEGGVEFIFTDVNLNREYRLVHSDKQGEIEDPTYYQMYRER